MSGMGCISTQGRALHVLAEFPHVPIGRKLFDQRAVV